MDRRVGLRFIIGSLLLIWMTLGCENPVLEQVKEKVDIYKGDIPVISVKYEGLSIPSGSTIPSVVNTYLGNPVELHFLIENRGDTNLRFLGSDAVRIDPDTNFYRSQTESLPEFIAPGENAQLTVIFNPATEGTKLALLEIETNDTLQSIYQILLTAGATLTPEPEILITQGGTEIVNAATDFSIADIIVDGAAGYRSTTEFTITNVGTANLLIGGVTLTGDSTADFSLQDNTLSSLPAEGSCSFLLEFDPLSVESGKSVILSISSNDTDEAPYTYTVNAAGTEWIGPTAFATNRVYGDRIVVSWNEQPYAERYDVYRSTSWSGPFSKIAETATTSFTNTIDTAGAPCLLDQGYVYKIQSFRLVDTTPVASTQGAGAFGERTGFYHEVDSWGMYGESNGRFDGVSAIDVDGDGNFYTIEDGHYSGVSVSRVQKFDSDGNYLSKWGSDGSGDGQFNAARGIALGSVSAVEKVFVADTGNHRIQRFSLDGTFEGWIGYDGTSSGWHAPGSGKTGAAGSTEGAFNSPMAVVCDNFYLYVSDTGNHRIQRFLLSNGSFDRSLGTYGSGDEQFNSPHGLAVDTNYLYVADTENHRIQKLFWGSGTGDYFYVRWGSYGTGDAQFIRPWGVGLGNNSAYLYVAQKQGDLVKQFDNPSTTIQAASVFVKSFETGGTTHSTYPTITDIKVVGSETLVICHYYDNKIRLFRWE